jgi:hypothetical protein
MTLAFMYGLLTSVSKSVLYSSSCNGLPGRPALKPVWMESLIIDADAAGNAFCMENKFTVGIIITARDFTIQSPRVADTKVHCYHK